MTEDHRFIDRDGTVVIGKGKMMEAWVRFFELFPEYQNSFTKVESNGNLVILFEYANWRKGEAPNHAIWTAMTEDSPWLSGGSLKRHRRIKRTIN